MLNVKTILDLLPWVLIAPAIPLLLMLLPGKPSLHKPQTSVLLLCVITILSNAFLIIGAQTTLYNGFIHVSFLASFIFTLLLLKSCTDNQVLRISILAVLILFIGVYLSFQYFSGDHSGMEQLNSTGSAIVFLLAILVLSSLAYKVDIQLLRNPDFWYTGGVFFHFGLLSLLLFTTRKITDIHYHEADEWSAFYAIIFCLQFVFFSVGVYLQRPWKKTADPLL